MEIVPTEFVDKRISVNQTYSHFGSKLSISGNFSPDYGSDMRLAETDYPLLDPMRFGVVHLFLLLINFTDDFQFIPLFIRQAAGVLGKQLINGF
jgi:hypothetical protein